MKKFFVLLVAIALSTMLYAAKGEQGSSHGQPFLTLQGQIDKLVGDADTIEDRLDGLESATAKLEQDVKALYIGLEGVMEDYVFPNAEAIGDNAEAILKLQDAIDGNSLLIEAMGNEIEWINEELAIKQNIIEGICPEGMAVVSINDYENDGVLMCETMPGENIFSVVRTKTRYVRAGEEKEMRLECPADTTMSGGGFDIRTSDVKVLTSAPDVMFGENGENYGVNAWRVEVENNARWILSFSTRVICLKTHID